MMKKILLSIILTITLFMGIAISSMPVEASGNELTSEYVFTNADYKAATNLAGVTNSFMFDGGFEGQVYHSKDIPIKGYTANLGVMFKLGVNITVKPSTENNKLISFSVIKASNDVIKSTMENAVMTLNNVEITDRFISDNGGYITTYTPIDPTQEMKITFNDEENRVYSFLITYSLPTVEKVTDGSFDTLAAAIEKDNIEEIIVTKTIMCNRADRDFILDAKNKIIRAEITGVDESGMIQAGSTVELINVIKNASATIKNATILGGSR